jgi:hypothetical protein
VLEFKVASFSSFPANRNLIKRVQNIQIYLKWARKLCLSPNYPFWANKPLRRAFSRRKVKKNAQKSKNFLASFDFELNFLRDRSFDLLFVSTLTFLRIFLIHSHPNQTAVISELEEN